VASDPTPIRSAQEMEDAKAKLAEVALEGLKSGGGGGTFDGMEPRIAKLEAQMTSVDSRLGRVETGLEKVNDRLRLVEIDLGKLTERVAHLPSKGFIVTTVTLSAAVLGALTLFGDHIRALLVP
jgi:hypothetical protein